MVLTLGDGVRFILISEPQMLILDRLIARSSRSLAVMISFARPGSGRMRGGVSGNPDDDGDCRVGRAFPLHPSCSSFPIRSGTGAAAGRERGSFRPQGDSPWIVERF